MKRMGFLSLVQGVDGVGKLLLFIKDTIKHEPASSIPTFQQVAGCALKGFTRWHFFAASTIRKCAVKHVHNTQYNGLLARKHSHVCPQYKNDSTQLHIT